MLTRSRQIGPAFRPDLAYLGRKHRPQTVDEPQFREAPSSPSLDPTVFEIGDFYAHTAPWFAPLVDSTLAPQRRPPDDKSGTVGCFQTRRSRMVKLPWGRVPILEYLTPGDCDY